MYLLKTNHAVLSRVFFIFMILCLSHLNDFFIKYFLYYYTYSICMIHSKAKYFFFFKLFHIPIYLTQTAKKYIQIMNGCDASFCYLFLQKKRIIISFSIVQLSIRESNVFFVFLELKKQWIKSTTFIYRTHISKYAILISI